MKLLFLFALLPICVFGQANTPETHNSKKHQRRIIEMSAAVGLVSHKDKFPIVSTIYNGKSVNVANTGHDVKCQVKISIYPFRFLNVGVIGSQMNVRYEAGGKHMLFRYRPLWQYGVFAEYSKTFKNVTGFVGANYSKVKFGYYNYKTLPHITGNGIRQNEPMSGLCVGVKYRVVDGIYGLFSLEYANAEGIRYHCWNGGVCFRF